MKAGKLAIGPWLSCPYNEDTLEDLPSSVAPYLLSKKVTKDAYNSKTVPTLCSIECA